MLIKQTKTTIVDGTVKPYKVLHWAQIGKRKSDILQGFPRTKGMSSSSPIIKNPTEYLINSQAMSKQTLADLGDRMVATCLTDDGIGLAAPQIGIFKSVILIAELTEHNTQTGEFKLYINPAWEPFRSSDDDPEINKALSEKVGDWESCLSVPDKKFWIERFDPVIATWFEYDTALEHWSFKRELLKGYKARVFQHECDHLEGRSIVDRWNQQSSGNNNKLK